MSTRFSRVDSDLFKIGGGNLARSSGIYSQKIEGEPTEAIGLNHILLKWVCCVNNSKWQRSHKINPSKDIGNCRTDQRGTENHRIRWCILQKIHNSNQTDFLQFFAKRRKSVEKMIHQKKK